MICIVLLDYLRHFKTVEVDMNRSRIVLSLFQRQRKTFQETAIPCMQGLIFDI